MPEQSNNPFNFWQDLKRRKVIRVIIVYSAASYVILELTSIIAEPFGLPDWTLKFVFVLLCIGLVLSIILSWIYDITPEGIQKTKPSKLAGNKAIQSTPLGWKISTYISVLVIIAFALAYIIGNIKQSSDISRLEKTIAVLPFENWSVGEENSHLGNAIANEIITELYKINEFHVRSYTSSSQYKGPDRPSIPQIGIELGANFIIEGAIERQDEDVNIHVQVIQADNDDHIWANKFEGKWKDFHEIQDEIAFQVADELKAALSPDEIENIQKIPTENLEAYEYYLRGNDFFKDRSYEERDWTVAINLYKKSIELDSTFALPYARLAKAYLSLYWFHYDRSSELLENSKKSIDVALKIDPDLGEAYIALGIYQYYVFLNYPEALKQFETALKYLPDNSECLFFMAAVYRRMGNWVKAKEYFIKSFKIDPRRLETTLNTAETLVLLGEYSEALHYINLTINISPESAEAHRYKIDLYLKWEGNTKNARKSLEETSLIFNLSLYPELIEKVVILDIFDGYYQNALDYLSTVNFEAVQPQFYYYPKSLYYAWIYDFMKDPERARHFYNLSQLLLEEKIEENPDDSRLFSSLGICYAGLGQKDQALQAGGKAVELLPISKEAYRGVYRLGDLARIYVMVGEYELALESLDYLLSIPGVLSAKLLQLDPIWKPLWDLPEFKELINNYSDN